MSVQDTSLSVLVLIGRVLLLGGTTEASELARLVSESHPSVELVVSFAGRTRARAAMPPGVDCRVGGFGGIDGLRDYIVAEQFDTVVDATHPFADRMPFHAHAACEATGTSLVRLVRPAWTQACGDHWTVVDDVASAAAEVERSGAARVLLTIGRQELAPFTRCQSTAFVIRSIDPPAPGLLDDAEVVLARGPFTVDDEIELLQSRRIDLVVSKNSGGTATRAKLEAARKLALPIVMVQRPPAPDADSVATVAEAFAWLVERLRGQQ